MTLRNLFLIVVTAVVIFVAFSVSRRNAPETEISTAPLYPELMNQLNDVDRIEVRSSKHRSVLHKKDDSWTMENRDGFPAKFNDVKRGLIQLAELKVLETKTAKPEKYAQLGVDDVDADGSIGRLVTVTGKAGKPYATLILGKKRKGDASGVAEHYVRRSGEAHALLVEGDLALPADPGEWINSDIANIPTKRIHRVTIEPYEGPPIVISKASPEDNFFELQNIPEGYVVTSKTTVSSLGAMLRDLRFTDVAAESGIESDIVPRTIVRVQTFDGLIATIEELDYKEHIYNRFSYEFNPDVVVKTDAEVQSTDTGADTEAAEKSAPSVEKEALTLNSIVAGWVFELPDYKVRMIDKKLADLIKVYEPPPPPVSDQPK